MPALVVETGSGLSTANTYATLAEADDYHARRLHTETWDGADVDVKAIALVWATSLLDTELQWLGTPATSTQALRWPRTNLYLDDERSVESTTIPTVLKDATAELARLLIEADRPALAEEREPSGQSASRAGSSGSVSYNASTARKRMVPETVRVLLRPYVDRAGRIVRG